MSATDCRRLRPTATARGRRVREAGGATSCPEPTLPEPVRQRVIALAAAAMPGLPADEVPVPLRRVAKFAPNRRARLGGPAIAAQLAADPLFRQRIGDRVVDRRRRPRRRRGRAASAPAAADPVEVAALAYLARPDGWRDLVDAAAEAVRAEADSAAVADQRPRRRAAGRPGRARPRGGQGRGRQAARRAGPGPRGAGPAARGGADAPAKALREAQAAQRTGERAAGHREGPGRPGRRRPRGRGAPAADPAGRGGAAAAAPASRAPRTPGRSTTPGSGCCWRRSARPPSGCAASWPSTRPTSCRPTSSPTPPPSGPARRSGPGPRPGHRRPGPARPAARPAAGAPDRRRVQRDQARLRRDVAGAAAQAG